MNPALYVCCLLLIILVIIGQRNQRMFIVRRIRRRKRGSIDMNELIQRFLGKNCEIYLNSGSAVEGTIEMLEGNWISVRTKKNVQLINLDYICRLIEKAAK